MTWMGLRDAKPQKGGKARIPCLGLVTVVTVSYFIEPMGRKNAKRMQLGGMQVIVLLLARESLLLERMRGLRGGQTWRLSLLSFDRLTPIFSPPPHQGEVGQSPHKGR
jgi:hypothetical protein